MNDGPPAGLVASYQRAVYRVLDPDGAFELRIGVHCAELQRWHKRQGVRSSAFISAANPFSVPTDAARNTAAHERLLGQLKSAGFLAVPGLGEDPDGQWVAEQCVLVAGIGEAAALRFAAGFNQFAIVFADHDAVPRLRFTAAASAG